MSMRINLGLSLASDRLTLRWWIRSAIFAAVFKVSIKFYKRLFSVRLATGHKTWFHNFLEKDPAETGLSSGDTTMRVVLYSGVLLLGIV